VVCGLGFVVSVETTTLIGLTSTFGSATSTFCKLPSAFWLLLSETCLASTIE
jgi:hypothetical protein